MKFGARAQPRAEMLRNSKPINSRDLCVNRTLNMPISKAKTTAATEESVFNCPAMPTEHSNVTPMSISRSPVRMLGGEVAK